MLSHLLLDEKWGFSPLGLLWGRWVFIRKGFPPSLRAVLLLLLQDAFWFMAAQVLNFVSLCNSDSILNLIACAADIVVGVPKLRCTCSQLNVLLRERTWLVPGGSQVTILDSGSSAPSREQ